VSASFLFIVNKKFAGVDGDCAKSALDGDLATVALEGAALGVLVLGGTNAALL